MNLLAVLETVVLWAVVAFAVILLAPLAVLGILAVPWPKWRRRSTPQLPAASEEPASPRPREQRLVLAVDECQEWCDPAPAPAPRPVAGGDHRRQVAWVQLSDGTVAWTGTCTCGYVASALDSNGRTYAGRPPLGPGFRKVAAALNNH